MTVFLTPQLEALVNQKVASGLYSSASEVIREALRLLEERDPLRDMRLEELRKELALGLEQLERGQSKPFGATTVERFQTKGRQRLGALRHSPPA